jgi:hypothetical protein
MSIVAERMELGQAGAAPLVVLWADDDHGRTKPPLPQRPRGPHPYPQVRLGGAVRVVDAEARQLLAGYSDDACVVARVSGIGVAA